MQKIFAIIVLLCCAVGVCRGGDATCARVNDGAANATATVSLDCANNVNVLADSFIVGSSNGSQTSEVWLPEVLAALIALVGVLMSALISYWVSRQVYVKNQIFDIKKDALLAALSVLDDYLSWLDFRDSNGNRSPNPVRRNLTSQELTIRVRECYNKLCVTCDNSMLLSSFLEIIFSEKGNVCEEYNKFRAAARKELGLSSFEFDSDRVFLSVVSTSNLSIK